MTPENILVNCEIIYYILHFEMSNNCIVKEKDNIFFNNNYCEIIKKDTYPTIELNRLIYNPSSSTICHCFWQRFKNKMISCIKNSTFNSFNIQSYNDIIRL